MANKNKCSCLLCKSEVAVCNIKMHYNSKQCQSSGKQIVSQKICKYCSIDFSTISSSIFRNHIRWCDNNPNFVLARSKNTGDQMQSEDALLKRKEAISKAHSNGKYANASNKRTETRIRNDTIKISDTAKENCRSAALKSKHQRVCKSTHDFIDKRGRTFRFDSSWEDALAIRLDELDITWSRPPPIEYELSGSVHNYFPDFYLPDYNVFLDPKNTYCQKIQKEKLDKVKLLINLTILNSLIECKEYSPI